MASNRPAMKRIPLLYINSIGSGKNFAISSINHYIYIRSQALSRNHTRKKRSETKIKRSITFSIPNLKKGPVLKSTFYKSIHLNAKRIEYWENEWIGTCEKIIWTNIIRYTVHSTHSSSIAAIQCQFKMPAIQSLWAKCHRYNVNFQYIGTCEIQRKYRLAKGT